MLSLLAAVVCLTAWPVTSQAEPTTSPSSTAGMAGGAGSTASDGPATPTDPATPNAADAAAGERAQRAKNAADRRVATLAVKISRESKHLAALSTTASLAEQRFTVQQTVQAKAWFAEAMTQLRLQVVRAQYRSAHAALIAIAVSSYQSDSAPGSISTSSVASLLTVDDPGEVLNAATEQHMLGEHQVDVVSRMANAVLAVKSAEQSQQRAVSAVVTETARLDGIRRRADSALAASGRAVVGLKADLVSAKAGQKQADAALSTFLGGWSAADPARAGALNKRYKAIAVKDAQAKAAPRSSRWTAGMGVTAMSRTLQYLGVNYAWAGGNTDGPTQGTCAGGGAQNDCHLVGFDCSGLAMYAWAPYLALPHNAAAQYNSGTVHPAPTALLPGDLLFWSSNHAASGIHHVAIYVGDGNVIQAPQSGDIVRITPMGNVSSGYFGATRPLS